MPEIDFDTIYKIYTENPTPSPIQLPKETIFQKIYHTDLPSSEQIIIYLSSFDNSLFLVEQKKSNTKSPSDLTAKDQISLEQAVQIGGPEMKLHYQLQKYGTSLQELSISDKSKKTWVKGTKPFELNGKYYFVENYYDYKSGNWQLIENSMQTVQEVSKEQMEQFLKHHIEKQSVTSIPQAPDHLPSMESAKFEAILSKITNHKKTQEQNNYNSHTHLRFKKQISSLSEQRIYQNTTDNKFFLLERKINDDSTPDLFANSDAEISIEKAIELGGQDMAAFYMQTEIEQNGILLRNANANLGTYGNWPPSTLGEASQTPLGEYISSDAGWDTRAYEYNDKYYFISNIYEEYFYDAYAPETYYYALLDSAPPKIENVSKEQMEQFLGHSVEDTKKAIEIFSKGTEVPIDVSNPYEHEHIMYELNGSYATKIGGITYFATSAQQYILLTSEQAQEKINHIMNAQKHKTIKSATQASQFQTERILLTEHELTENTSPDSTANTTEYVEKKLGKTVEDRKKELEEKQEEERKIQEIVEKGKLIYNNSVGKALIDGEDDKKHSRYDKKIYILGDEVVYARQAYDLEVNSNGWQIHRSYIRVGSPEMTFYSSKKEAEKNIGISIDKLEDIARKTQEIVEKGELIYHKRVLENDIGIDFDTPQSMDDIKIYILGDEVVCAREEYLLDEWNFDGSYFWDGRYIQWDLFPKMTFYSSKTEAEKDLGKSIEKIKREKENQVESQVESQEVENQEAYSAEPTKITLASLKASVRNFFQRRKEDR